MHRLEVKRQMTPDDVAVVGGLLDAAERADGHAAVGDHAWLDLVQGGRPGFAGLVVWETGHDHPVAYAQVTRGNDSWGLELVVHPHHRYDLDRIGPALLDAALDVVSSGGGGHLHWWVFEPSEAHVRLATDHGLRPGRRLLQLRRPLPAPPPPPLDLRPFEPGRDEEAWLAINNRAFDQHPEQGGWTLETLQAREAEPWFDPTGFLLHERDGRLAAFCWTKVHADHDPPLGEIYVIAVDPDFHGLGLGRSLVLAGLDSLARHGLGTAMLYVDADNRAAVRLYESLGFAVHHTDRAFVGDVPDTSSPSP